MNTRLNGHREDTANKVPKVVAEHFCLPEHFFGNLKFYEIKQTLILHDRENRWIGFWFTKLTPLNLCINISRGKFESIELGNLNANLSRSKEHTSVGRIVPKTSADLPRPSPSIGSVPNLLWWRNGYIVGEATVPAIRHDWVATFTK